MIEIRPATPADVRNYYGGPPQKTMRAYVVVADGEIIAIGGFIRIRSNVMALFSDIKTGMQEAHPVTAVRFAKKLMKIADDNGWTLLSWPAEDILKAPKFLRYLGFEPTDSGEWIR